MACLNTNLKKKDVKVPLFTYHFPKQHLTPLNIAMRNQVFLIYTIALFLSGVGSIPTSDVACGQNKNKLHSGPISCGLYIREAKMNKRKRCLKRLKSLAHKSTGTVFNITSVPVQVTFMQNGKPYKVDKRRATLVFEGYDKVGNHYEFEETPTKA